MNVELPLAHDVKVIKETIKAINDGYRIIGHRGGSRSSKTYSLVQLMIWMAYHRSYHFSIVSTTMPHLKRGALRDWQQQMVNGGYIESYHNKTDQVYNYPSGSMMEFFSVDSADKVRGLGRDICFFNEMNLERNYDTFTQLIMRTRKIFIYDYNPADEYHWIYDEIETRDDCKLIVSTYQDNPFLPEEQKKEIERLKGNAWKVYGLGERGQREGLIFPDHKVLDFDFDNIKNTGYGLDFGFSSDPTALTRVGIEKDNLYAEELIYQTGLTNSDLIKMLGILKVSKVDPIYADSAEPQRIEEIRRAGYNIKPVKKGADSIKVGIESMQRYNIHLHSKSVNLIKEFKSYSWMTDKDNKQLPKPVPFNDHACDSVRYFVHMMTYKPKRSGQFLFRA